MELVEGETLEALVRREGPLKVQAALEMATQVTQALIAAGAQGLVHRDLKPGNIMLTRAAGVETPLAVKVIDFGLAKAVANGANEMELTQGGFVGTPAFASPEQFSGAPADARSDIYSLGMTLWYALSGELPYAAGPSTKSGARKAISPCRSRNSARAKSRSRSFSCCSASFRSIRRNGRRRQGS